MSLTTRAGKPVTMQDSRCSREREIEGCFAQSASECDQRTTAVGANLPYSDLPGRPPSGSFPVIARYGFAPRDRSYPVACLWRPPGLNFGGSMTNPLRRRRYRIDFPFLRDPLLGCDHQAVCNLYRQRPCIRWAEHVANDARGRGAADVDHRVRGLNSHSSVYPQSKSSSLAKLSKSWTIVLLDPPEPRGDRCRDARTFGGRRFEFRDQMET